MGVDGPAAEFAEQTYGRQGDADVAAVLTDLAAHERAVYDGTGVKGPDVLAFVQRARAVLERLGDHVCEPSTIEQVNEFHEAFGVTVRGTPTADITPEERLLRVRLVVEEALEFAFAMGCVVEVDPRFEWGIQEAEVSVLPDHPIDLVEAADALADLDYVVTGSALTMGIPHRAVVQEVHRSNMSKLDPVTLKPIYREGDSKVLKGDAYSPPDVTTVLVEHGWEEPS